MLPIASPVQVVDEQLLIKRLQKSIQLFAGIDFTFSILVFVSYAPLLGGLLFPAAGYYGASNLKSWGLYMYAIYLIVCVIGRTAMLIYGTQDHMAISILLYMLTVYVNSMICRMIFSLVAILRFKTADEIRSLRENEPVAVVQYIYYPRY